MFKKSEQICTDFGKKSKQSCELLEEKTGQKCADYIKKKIRGFVKFTRIRKKIILCGNKRGKSTRM